MLENLKFFIYKFDIIGPIPQLMIFKNIRYQSLFSSVISIIIFLFSILFIIYSFKEFLEYKSSNIAYTKANDQETQRVIYIKETSLIFQLIDYTKISGVDKSVAYFEGDFNIIYNNGTTYNEPNID